jgi:hypothetical protein
LHLEVPECDAAVVATRNDELLASEITSSNGTDHVGVTQGKFRCWRLTPDPSHMATPHVARGYWVVFIRRSDAKLSRKDAVSKLTYLGAPHAAKSHHGLAFPRRPGRRMYIGDGATMWLYILKDSRIAPEMNPWHRPISRRNNAVNIVGKLIQTVFAGTKLQSNRPVIPFSIRSIVRQDIEKFKLKTLVLDLRSGGVQDVHVGVQ